MGDYCASATRATTPERKKRGVGGWVCLHQKDPLLTSPPSFRTPGGREAMYNNNANNNCTRERGRSIIREELFIKTNVISGNRVRKKTL